MRTKPPSFPFCNAGGAFSPYMSSRVTAKNLKPIVNQMIAKDALLMTDTSTVLASAGSKRKHFKVNHSVGEYVRREKGIVITQTRLRAISPI